MTANLRTSRVATACLIAAASVTPAMAQEYDVGTGIVRISDSKTLMATRVQKGEVQPAPGVYAPGAYDGYVDGTCPHCQGKHKHKGGVFKEHYCTHSPDHGYSIPGKWPIQRRGVEYQHLFPPAYYSVYTGAPYLQAAPQVYMPTDTTQLGYYYQHVPFWQPAPQMLPPRPVPAQWHHYAPVVYASQYGRMYSKGGAYEGQVIYETAAPTTTPAAAPTQLQPVPEGSPAQDLPPKPLMESAVPLPLERVDYQQ